MGHPNEDLLRHAYGLRDEAEVAPLRQWLHDEVVWHTDTGDLHGPDQVLAMLAGADEAVGRTQSHDVHAILADDDYGMVFNTVRATRADRDLRYEDRHVHVYRFSDGRIIEYWGFLGDPPAAEDFWASRAAVADTDLGPDTRCRGLRREDRMPASRVRRRMFRAPVSRSSETHQLRQGAEFGAMIGAMDLSNDVEPVTALKRSAADLIARATDRHSPIVITQNGKPTAVLQDVHSYQRQQRVLHLLKLIAQGEQDHRAGRMHDQASLDGLVSARLAERRGAL